MCIFPPRTDLKPWLTVRKPINSPVLSLTLLQIYCIGLIGPISYSFWVWATICDPTIIYLENITVKLFFLIFNMHVKFGWNWILITIRSIYLLYII